MDVHLTVLVVSMRDLVRVVLVLLVKPLMKLAPRNVISIEFVLFGLSPRVHLFEMRRNRSHQTGVTVTM
jgi:hypothetical protein